MTLNPPLRSLRLFAWLCMLLFGSAVAEAHEARPVAIELVETAVNQFSVSMRMPGSLPPAGLPRLAMPTDCYSLTESGLQQTRSGYLLNARFQCRERLAGQTLAVMFPGNQVSTNTLFRLTLLSGESYRHLLGATESEWQIPESENRFQVAWQYSGLGIQHIFGGVDHLLFVACLIFIARSWRRVVITITGFTLAHSLTLFLSALDLVSVAVAPVEAVIALSILFLAHEIAVDNRQSWTWRYPIAVSASFGLLHGFGFAAVLKEVGLPQTELITGLLFFNLGVEVGQIAFIALLLLAAKIFTTAVKQQPLPVNEGGLRQGFSYAIGTIAAYWFIARVLVL